MNPPRSSKEVHLVSYPQGESSPADFAVVEALVPDPAPGRVLVHRKATRQVISQRRPALWLHDGGMASPSLPRVP